MCVFEDGSSRIEKKYNMHLKVQSLHFLLVSFVGCKGEGNPF